jgi:hypothetical protein
VTIVARRARGRRRGTFFLKKRTKGEKPNAAKRFMRDIKAGILFRIDTPFHNIPRALREFVAPDRQNISQLQPNLRYEECTLVPLKRSI